MESNYKNILITGGCGFCGSAFVRYVVNNVPNARVTILDKLTYAANPDGIAGLPEDRVKLVVGDICDRICLIKWLPGTMQSFIMPQSHITTIRSSIQGLL